MSDYTSVEQRASYGVGRQMGEQLLTNAFNGIDIKAVAAGVIDAFTGVKCPVSDADMNAAFQEINQKMKTELAAKKQRLSAEGEQFLAENAKRVEVKVTDSGLQYEILETGQGPKPSSSSTVRTHYSGTLIDGTVFDSSYQRGEPAEFPVGGVIKGWTEALQMMNCGSKWRLYIPYDLAYGEQGAGGVIGPFATLIFDLELISIL